MSLLAYYVIADKTNGSAITNQNNMEEMMMKKLLAVLLSLTLMVAALAGCSSTNDSSTSTPQSSAPSTPSEPTVSGEPAAQELTNIEKAIAVISSFASGDTSVPQEYLTEGYIQHNLAYGTGRDAFIGSVEYLGAADVKTTVNNIRAFEDGDYVFLHTIYNFAGAGEQVAFDIFRFENGKIAEHWDNLAFLAEPNASGHTQTDGATDINDLDKAEENKALCEQFIKDVLMGQNPDALTSYFDGDTYIQHNSSIADGLSGLGEALAAMADAGIEMIYDEIHLVLGQGNFVLAVSEGTFGGEHTAYYDLWRVEDGKIIEHWDVIETIMAESEWANQNGKF